MSKEQLDLVSVKVRLFARAREIVGKEEVSVSLAKQTTVGYLRKKFFELYPALASKKVPFVIAVNHKVVDDSTAINHLDEVAILPPVSGG